MSTCDYKIAKDIDSGCSNISKGVEKVGYIVNYYDVIKVQCGLSANILTSLALVSGAKGYKIIVPEGTPFNGTLIEAVVGTYKTQWNKTVQFVLLDSGPDVCADVIDKLANGKFVIVLENVYAGTDSKNKFEVYGFEQGLKRIFGAVVLLPHPQEDMQDKPTADRMTMIFRKRNCAGHPGGMARR